MNSNDSRLANNSWQAITDMFRVIRRLQVVNGFKSSDILKVMFNVWARERDVFMVNTLVIAIQRLWCSEQGRE